MYKALLNCSSSGYISEIWAGQSKKVSYGFSDEWQAIALDDVTYDVTLLGVQNALQTFQQNTVTIVF